MTVLNEHRSLTCGLYEKDVCKGYCGTNEAGRITWVPLAKKLRYAPQTFSQIGGSSEREQ
jgi:hypothetical protein